VQTRNVHILISQCSAALAVAALFGSPTACADATAYLANVTVWPGYHFADAQDALSCGQQICDKMSAGRGYALLIGDVEGDLNTGDEYQASYLITQAVNELVPAQIWSLRNSAAHYRSRQAP
jgi:hypothetical protein